MKHDTRKLEGAQLDAAVALASGGDGLERYGDGTWYYDGPLYSTDLERGGHIIEREGIEIHAKRYDSGKRRCWVAVAHESAGIYSGLDIEGPTQLIAGLRCFVFNQLGPEVDLP